MMAGRSLAEAETKWSSWWFLRGAVAFSLLALLCPNGLAATTDPVEVRALNSIFLKWKISSTMSRSAWNTTNDPCSGAALTGVYLFDDDVAFNPAILCNCSFNNGSTCHITRLKAHNLEIVGTIPEELKYFKYLNNLQIGINYLSGPLPAFIGDFMDMEWLSIGKNLLSGPVPKELGNLQKLRSLGIGSNNFSGPLPPELGNMENLEQIYIDSMGLTGEIPSTFGKLRKLWIMMASNNDFRGRLPDFIGNLTNLKTLRLQGNSFQGPIPQSFSNLTKLVNLRMSNLLNERSSLEFIKNLTNLSTLVLTGCNIVGTIPSDIGEFRSLTHLDLSFNGLTGSLPSAVFNIESLEYMFLGSNNLSGNLPGQKSRKLLNIDLSYNALSGKLPSWAFEDNLNLNLVANSFVLDDSNKWGLNCLQNNFPCFRGSPVYYSFAVNCGGNEIDTSDGIHFSADDNNLSTASYYVSKDKRWAVNSSGKYVDAPNPKYVEFNSSARFDGTTDQQLFQSARLSPSSLRYYGLALENGNYTVSLQFAETAFPDSPDRLTVGRRIFDIYVQGDLVQKDFDIRKEAGRSYVAVMRNYTATVIDNHLEVHLFWAGKGTCCVPTRGYYGPSISAISISPNFKPTVSNHLPNTSTNKKALMGGISAAILSMLILVAGTCLWRLKVRHDLNAKDVDLKASNVVPEISNYLKLRNACEDLIPANKVGDGGFGYASKEDMDLSDGKDEKHLHT